MNFRNQMFAGFGDDETDYKAELILQALVRKYGEPSCGRNRVCFYSKNYVIKFPLNWNGIGDNDWEGSVSDEIYAKSRHTNIDDFLCVVAERLVPYYEAGVNYRDLPDWTGGIDCA